MSAPFPQKISKGSRSKTYNQDKSICSYNLPSSNISTISWLIVLCVADPRFSTIQTDPRFRLPSKRNTHVQIDKRFAHMLRDEGFSSTAKVDRYGRKLSQGSGKRELERFYRVEGVEDKNEDYEGRDEVDDDEEVTQELWRVGKQEKSKYDPARNGGFDESSSGESSSEDDDADVEEEEVAGFADQYHAEGEEVQEGEVSSRLAIVNLDWDNIRAADLMAVFESFVPSGSGRILKVEIFPSEFGKERMEREETEGPPKEIFVKRSVVELQSEVAESSLEEKEQDGAADGDGDEDERIRKSILEEDQGEEFDSAKLRRYQLERLRYFYAVLTCSSKSVAEALYNSVDGTEYLTTANFFDLRFIPEEMDFSDDKPHDLCERIPDGYRPNEFVTDALQHSKVRLTWDADDNNRKEIQKRAFARSRTEIAEDDLRTYLGSDSSSEEDVVQPVVVDSTIDSSTHAESLKVSKAKQSIMPKKEAERQRMRALLGLTSEPEPSRKLKPSEDVPIGDMQITFSSGLSGNSRGSIFENEPEPAETTVEKYVRKEKERKARRKEKTKATRNGSIATEPEEGRNEVENEASDLGFDDPFFSAPTDDKAAAIAVRSEKKRQKKAERAAADAVASAQRAELELLMVDDDDPTIDKSMDDRIRGNHFNINEIVRAEKALKKKGKRLSSREKAALEAKQRDNFQIDVSDPRFSAVFERSEFALDPSNPRFKGTEGMKAFLEEGRKKRTRTEDDEGDAGITRMTSERRVRLS